MLVNDGVEFGDFEGLKVGFQAEGASIVVVSPQKYLSVESVDGYKRGRDITADISFESVFEEDYEGLIIPSGVLSTGLLKEDARVLQMVTSFHAKGKPIFASGNSVELLYESHVLPRQVLVREEAPLPGFIGKAVTVLINYSSFT